MKKIKLLQNVPFSPNGLNVETWNKNDVKEVNDAIFKSFIADGLAVEFKPEPIVKATPKTEVKPKKNGRGRPKKKEKSEKEAPINKMFGFAPDNK